MSADAFLRGMQIAQQGAYYKKRGELDERQLSLLEQNADDQRNMNQAMAEYFRAQSGAPEMSTVPGSKPFDPATAYANQQLLGQPIGVK